MENYEKNGLPEYIGAVVALTALIPFMIAAVADRIGWYSYIIVAAMALGEGIWLAAGVHKRKKTAMAVIKKRI